MIRLASAAMLSLALLFAFALPAAASQDITPPYLALGDSVAFGYRGGLPPQDYADPNAFVGYPQLLAQMLGLNLTNAACPGQTSGSFISTSAPDNGCNAYRAAFPLHTQYTGTQLAFAIAFLRAHPNTQLVTLGLGANDLFLLQDACAGSTQCVEQGLPGLLRSLSHNLDTIDNGLRTAAGYHGRLVGVTYYATDYRNAAEVEAVGALDLAIATETLAHGGRVADGFVAFAIASRSSGGDVCAAGLLNRLPTGVCDVHPSLKGHAV
ncbi:MAG: SGNH/GDSL hydrolase family protein, partial [Chloroflexi bacterium]|nr:SGNH/GDSL hydrolase family protein [Chloroflexota bacterium]